MSLDLILLFVSLFTWGIGEGLFFFFQPIYLAELGADTMTIAGVFSAFGLAMMVAHVPAGYLADRIGRKPLLIAAWTSGLLATWVMALARTLPAFIVGMLLYGLTAFVSSPLNSYVTAARGKLAPARAMTFMSAAFNFGAVIGPLAGGWIGDHVGLRTVYFIAGGLFVISTAVLFFLRSQPTDRHDPSSPPAKLLTNTRFVGFLGIIFVVMFASYLPQPFTARFLENERQLSLSAIGLLGSVNGLGNALLNLLLGQFSARLGLALVQLCVMAFSLLIWRGAGLEWYAAGYFILGGYRAARPFIFAQVRSLIHSAQMGIAYGIAETFNALALALAPLLAGLLYTRDPALVYPAALGLLAVTLAVGIAFAPRDHAGGAAPEVRTLES
ncbi:MAG: major facilitator superfamily transporter [Anaerolineaceae bacterium]|nr:MAG: major facilitator superfamily transporter [Anaerolineaceae bacterium]